MRKGSLWYNPNDGEVGVVRSFGWHCRNLQPGQPITYQVQPTWTVRRRFGGKRAHWRRMETGGISPAPICAART